MINKKSVLVTGGAGFIGSHLCRILLQHNYRVYIIDNLSTGKLDNIPHGAIFIKGDIGNSNTLAKILPKVETIFHLAAKVTIRKSLDNFYDDAQTNIMGTINILNLLKHYKKIKNFIFTSSMAVYADSPQAIPLNENYKVAPISPYGISKLACERYIHLICQDLKIKSTCARLFNTYGKGQAFTPYVGVITIFINQLLAGKSPTIYGDGRQKRDFIYVEDVAKAILQCSLIKTNGLTINIGTGKSTSVNEIARLLIKKINPSIKPIYLKTHPAELKNSIADNSLLIKTTGFLPKVKLEEKIEEIIFNIKNNTNLK